MRECRTCRFCCWSFNVHDVPDSIKGLAMKSARTHCPYECVAGCSIHKHQNYPQSCHDFVCPYLEGEDIHRPDAFQQTVEELNGNMANFIPHLSARVPVEESRELITSSRSVPASILQNGQWVEIIMPLDKENDGSWAVTEDRVIRWEELYARHGELLPLQMRQNVNVLII